MLWGPLDRTDVVMPNTPVVASAVPSIFNCVKLVIPSPLVPLSVVPSRDSPVGAAGAIVSAVTEYAVDATPVFPAASVALAVMPCVPLDSPEVVMLNAPVVALAMPEPSTVVPLVSYSVTVLPASAGPSIFGCVKLVIPSPFALLSVVLSSDSPVGANGAIVSTVTA